MKTALQVTFRNMERSEWLDNLIRKRVEKLEALCSDIIGCHVTVEIPHKHHHQGNFYSIRIKLTVPNKEIMVNREPDKHSAYEDINAVIKDVFDSAKRQLEDYVRLRRGAVKHHELTKVQRQLKQELQELKES